MDKLQKFVDKYKDLKYPHNKSTSELIDLFKKVGNNYVSESLVKDTVNTWEVKNKDSLIKPNEFLDHLQRLINIRLHRR